MDIFFSPPDISIHWASPQKPMVPEGIWYQAQAPSAEVEMSAYVLLAYLTAQPAPTQEDLTAATLIVKWLTKQQNSHGGFSSTQVRYWSEPFTSHLNGERLANYKHTREQKSVGDLKDYNRQK